MQNNRHYDKYNKQYEWIYRITECQGEQPEKYFH